MNPKTQKQLVVAGIFISLAAIIYFLKKGGNGTTVTNPAPNNASTNSNATAGGTGQSGCTGCPSFQNVTAMSQISFTNPASNRNKCGQPVQYLQEQINLLTYGANLVVDGCYGPATQAQHAATLANNNGAWPVTDATSAYQGPSFTNPNPSAPTTTESNWWDFFNPLSASFFNL